jgi:glycosyltransferase involved in cell wall biosynthesis
LTIGLAGLSLARHFGVPHVFEVRDLWPQALINLGALKNPLVIAWMRWMERHIYAKSQHIVALSPGMKQGVVASGVVHSDKVSVIPNASDIDLFRPDLDREAGRVRLNLGEQIAAIYFGGMGLANGLEYAIDAARILQQRGNRQLVIVLHGSGGRRKAHEDQVKQLGLRNVIFSDPVPDKSVVAQLVAACDICLTIYRASKEHTWSPNKMFDAFAAGRPVIINVPGWLGETVESNQCGLSVDPDRPEALADALERLAVDPELRTQMGKNARNLAERQFSRAALASKLEQVLQDAIRQACSK